MNTSNSTSDTSTSKAALLLTFCEAQGALVKSARTADRANLRREESFIRSALAASVAIVGGVSLAALVNGNVAYCEANGIDADSAPRDSLYVSKAALAVHALTGDVLSLALSADEDAATMPGALSVQGYVRRVYKGEGLGASVVRRIVRKAATQQAALAELKAALAGAQAAREDSTDDESAIGAPVTLADVIRGAVALIVDGAPVDADAQAALAELRGAVSKAVRDSKAAPVAA